MCKTKTHIKINNLSSRLLKTMKYKDRNIKDILPKNKEYKLSNDNNYRIFKNYDTNPSINKEEKNIEKANKYKNCTLKELTLRNINCHFSSLLSIVSINLFNLS